MLKHNSQNGHEVTASVRHFFTVIIYRFGGKYCLISTISKPINLRIAKLKYTK